MRQLIFQVNTQSYWNWVVMKLLIPTIFIWNWKQLVWVGTTRHFLSWIFLMVWLSGPKIPSQATETKKLISKYYSGQKKKKGTQFGMSHQSARVENIYRVPWRLLTGTTYGMELVFSSPVLNLSSSYHYRQRDQSMVVTLNSFCNTNWPSKILVDRITYIPYLEDKKAKHVTQIAT